MNVVIFGATSAIAQAAAQVWAKRGDKLLLIARSQEKLVAVTHDLATRTQSNVTYKVFDLAATDQHDQLFAEINQHFSVVDRALIAHGSLPDQRACENDINQSEQQWTTNFNSPALLTLRLLKLLRSQEKGRLGVITSVAGERGRQSNNIYGSAKGGLSILLAGIQHQLHGKDVSVTDIRPGFVATPMTAHLKQGFLFVEPETIAKSLVNAIDAGRSVVYLPWFWRWIMLIIRCVPRFLFHRTQL